MHSPALQGMMNAGVNRLQVAYHRRLTLDHVGEPAAASDRQRFVAVPTSRRRGPAYSARASSRKGVDSLSRMRSPAVTVAERDVRFLENLDALDRKVKAMLGPAAISGTCQFKASGEGSTRRARLRAPRSNVCPKLLHAIQSLRPGPLRNALPVERQTRRGWIPD